MARPDTDRRAATIPPPAYLRDENPYPPEFTITALPPDGGEATYIVTMNSVGGVHASIQTTRAGVEALRGICNTVLLTED